MENSPHRPPVIVSTGLEIKFGSVCLGRFLYFIDNALDFDFVQILKCYFICTNKATVILCDM